MPMLLGQRVPRASFCSRRGARTSQAAIAAKMPAKTESRMSGSWPRRISGIGMTSLMPAEPQGLDGAVLINQFIS